MSITTPSPTPEAPRLRFAPSPTGFFHVGSARSALFNSFVARRTGGSFLLRIEDTDAERNREEWVQGIQDAMRWIGLDWDGDVFFQSRRTSLYQASVERLLASGRAYHCACTAEEVRARNIANFGPKEGDRGYDGHCREQGLPEGAVRFRTPDHGTTTVVDLIRGEPAFDNALIEDFVIRRTNGGFMFLLANVVDDIDMRITHVVRGEEHLPNTPKAVLLWRALTDLRVPVFAHLPVIVNEKRQKLSKRRDKVALEDYRTLGVLPDAMANYLALLGWTPPSGNEIITRAEMIRDFRLEDVNKSSAFFDFAKLSAFNGDYIRALPVEEFVELARPYLDGPLNPIHGPLPSVLGNAPGPQGEPGDGATPSAGAFEPERFDLERFRAIAPLVQERVRLLSEVPGVVDFFFLDEPVIDRVAWDKTLAAPGSIAMLDGVLADAEATDWTADALKGLVEALGTANGLKLGKAQAPIRVALTGRTVGPPLFESMEILGREVSLHRIRAARASLR